MSPGSLPSHGIEGARSHTISITAFSTPTITRTQAGCCMAMVSTSDSTGFVTKPVEWPTSGAGGRIASLTRKHSKPLDCMTHRIYLKPGEKVDLDFTEAERQALADLT